jgi:hypothetical protein
MSMFDGDLGKASKVGCNMDEPFQMNSRAMDRVLPDEVSAAPCQPERGDAQTTKLARGQGIIRSTYFIHFKVAG